MSRATPAKAAHRNRTRSNTQPSTDFARALAAMRAGDLVAAEAGYRRCLGRDPDNAAAHHHLGLLAAKKERYEEAARHLRRAIALHPKNLEAHESLAAVLRHMGQLDEAVEIGRRAIALTDDGATDLLTLGTSLLQSNDLVHAERILARAAERDSASAPVAFSHAEALRRLGRLDEAEASCARGLALDPRDAEGLNLKGLLDDHAGRLGPALSAFKGALRQTEKDAIVCSNIANVHLQQQNFEEAIRFARKALAIDNKNSAALGSLGLTFQRQGRVKEAIETFSRAIDVQPTWVRHYTNLSALLIAIAEPDTAIAACRVAIGLDDTDAEAHFNLAVALRQKKLTADAIEYYRAALARGCDEASVDICHLRQEICDWPGLAEEQAYARTRTYRAGKPVAPFSVMTASDDPVEHLLCASIEAKRCPNPERPLAPYRPRTENARIRVGYLSCDYFDHATTSLIAQLIERHDRSRFEAIAYSFGPEDGSDMQRRVKAAFDRFTDIRDLPHFQAARLIKDDGIDILVDLKGYTQGCRADILAYRPAPIQVNYLGYPGSMGARFIDYIVGDPIVTPFDNAAHFAEHIVQLPHTYQPNDRLRTVAEAIGTRIDHGLPATGFVFCCFNNTYKLTPLVFASWMRLLGAVPGSMLWLLETNRLVAANLRREAAGHGIDPDRIVFAPRVRAEDHIARMSLADLFLDTLPINAHTTASEALWAGLPVLTCLGHAFAGRVAASLLQAIDLPELVTTSFEAYEARALALAQDPDELGRLRARLAANRLATPLFDIDRYTRNYEAALMQMVALRDAGIAPHPFAIADQTPASQGHA